MSKSTESSPVDIKWVAEPSTGRGRTAFRQAKALFQDGHIEEALRMYTQVRDSLDRSDSYWAICHNQMGLCYSKLGNDAEAIKSYTTAIETGEHKDMHIWHMNRAVKLKVSGDFERAKEDFERVIKLRADSPQAQKAKDHLARMQSPVRYSPVVEPHGSRGDANSHRNMRKHVIDLWNRLATAFGQSNDAQSPSTRTETPPDAVCCSLLLLGDVEILKWFLLGTTSHLGPNPWKAQGCLDDVDVLARLGPYSIPIISGWLGDMCESGNVTLASRSTAVRKWLSNDSVVKSAPVSMNQVEARLSDTTLEHCAAISGDVVVLQWFTTTFSLARERRLQDLAAKVQADPDDVDSVALLSAAVAPAPKANTGETPDCFIPDRSIAAVALHSPGAEGHADSSREARKYLSDMYTSVERYRLESACAKGIPLGIYVLFWAIEAFAAYHIVLIDPYESLQALHNIPWYSCAVVLFAFSWLIPGLRDVGPIPGWLVHGVPAVLWGGALVIFCVIQMLTAFQQLGNVLPEYGDWTHACTGMLLLLGYLVPHTQPLSTWSNALAYGHSISWSLLLVYLTNRIAWGADDVHLESDGFFLLIQATFYAMSAFHPCQYPTEDDRLKTLLVWSYTMLWRLLVAFFTASMGEWVIGHYVPTIMYSLAMLQTGCLVLLITYTTLWYSFDADKNVAKQGYVKVRVLLYKFGLVQPLSRQLKDDLRDWRARTIKDRLAMQLQETLTIVKNGFGAPKALTRYDCANPRSPQKRQFNLDYLRATKLVDDEICLAALGESLDPELAEDMLTLTDKLQDYIFGCLNACLTRHDKLMRGMPPILNGAGPSSHEQADPVFFDEVVGMLMFLIDEGGRWEKRFAEGDCDGPTVADRRELAIGRAWLANVPAQRLRIMQAWERARQEKLDAEKARQEEARLRQLEEAKRAAEAELEREKVAALQEQQRKENAKKAAERRMLEEARLAEQAKVEEANRKKREEARLKRQKEAAALKDAQRREQMLATKKKQLSTEESKAQKLLKNGDPSAAAKAFSKAIRVATDLNDEAEIERLKQSKQEALSAAAALAEQAKAKAAEEKAKRKAAEQERKLAAAAERERLEKLEQKRQEEAAARVLAERRAKHDATIERIEKAIVKTQEMLDRGEGTQAVRAIEKVPTLMQMLDSQFGGGISQQELAKLQAKCKAAEAEYIKKSAALAEQKKKEAAERRKKQAEEKAAAEKKAAEEKEAAEAAAAVAAAKAAEEEAEREKAKLAAEAAAFEAQMAEYALKEVEPQKDDEQNGAGENRDENSPENDDGRMADSTPAADGSTPQGDFNIEMALGRDLLGDLGMDDDDLDGSCEAVAELAQLSVDEELSRTLESSDHRLNDCLCPITHEIMRDPVIDALGHSYERKAIESWLANHQTSPITNQTLPHRNLVTNHALRKLILSLTDEERATIRRRASSSSAGGSSANGQQDRNSPTAFTAPSHGTGGFGSVGTQHTRGVGAGSSKGISTGRGGGPGTAGRAHTSAGQKGRLAQQQQQTTKQQQPMAHHHQQQQSARSGSHGGQPRQQQQQQQQQRQRQQQQKLQQKQQQKQAQTQQQRQRRQSAQPASANPFARAGGSAGAGNGGASQPPIPEGSDPGLAALLTSLDLGRFLPQFAKEEMDMEAFGMLDDEDLQEMGIAKGPRLKLLQAINQVANSS